MTPRTLEMEVVIRASLNKVVCEGTFTDFMTFVKDVCNDFDARAAAIALSERVFTGRKRE